MLTIHNNMEYTFCQTTPRNKSRSLKCRQIINVCGFCAAFPAIQSYRQTFRIHDPLAYPWWFVDCRLTERQLNWTHRRLPIEDLSWRF